MRVCMPCVRARARVTAAQAARVVGAGRSCCWRRPLLDWRRPLLDWRRPLVWSAGAACTF